MSETREDLKTRLIKAYGGGEAGKVLAETEMRFREADCAHLLCGERAYQDGGAQWCGIPLCPRHAHLGSSIVDADDVRRHLQEARAHITRAQRLAFSARWTLAAAVLTVVMNLVVAWLR